MTDDSLQRAIGLVQAGKMEAAREELEGIIKNDRSNIPAWHWYAQTWPGAKEKIRIWQACLRCNPASEQAQQALKDLSFDPQRQINLQRKPPAFPKKSTGPSSLLLWLGIALLAAVAVFAWTAVEDSTSPLPSAPSPTFTSKDPQQYRHVQPVEYYLYVPEGYSSNQEWPLFVGIHGAGGNGLHCWQLWQAYADQEGFILLCPSIPGSPDGFYQDVGETTVWSAVGEVKKQYRIKPRMFFAGFSAGAFFIQGFDYHYPEAVSGLSILSSGMYLSADMFAEPIPVLVVIGDSDNPAAVEASQTFVRGLKGYRFNVQYALLPGVGHTVTKEGINLTIDLFRRRIRK